MGKKKRDRFSRDNKTETKELIPIILIVCEGEKTEPHYFNQFEVAGVKIEAIGIGDNTKRLVEHAIAEYDTRKYDKVWCVFDKDSFPNNDFNDAVQLARNKNLGIAYSNESFELWYVLHFQFLDSQIDRNQYIERLNRIFKSKESEGFPAIYQKNDKEIYRLLKPYQNTALKNAKRLAANYSNELDPSPVTQFPMTYVYKLVEELNRWLPSQRLG